MENEQYLVAGAFIDSDAAEVRAFAEKAAADASDEVARAVKLYYAVRDGVVYDHLSSPSLIELLGTDLFLWHSFAELYLDEQWVKATPAFNMRLCQHFGVVPLEFDGWQDSLFQEYNQGGRRFMEYVTQRGSHTDVPYGEIVADFKRVYPRWLALAKNGTRDFAAGGGGRESHPWKSARRMGHLGVVYEEKRNPAVRTDAG
jgi:hypothetical protein